jgi:hypothetical protein
MTVDRYIKSVLTVIALALSIIAISLASPLAHATRTDAASGMDMVRFCERTSVTINCVDITSDYAMKVDLSDASIRKLEGISDASIRKLERISDASIQRMEQILRRNQ